MGEQTSQSEIGICRNNPDGRVQRHNPVVVAVTPSSVWITQRTPTYYRQTGVEEAAAFEQKIASFIRLNRAGEDLTNNCIVCVIPQPAAQCWLSKNIRVKPSRT